MPFATTVPQRPRSKTAGVVGQIEVFAGTVMSGLLAVAVCLFGAFLCLALGYPEIAKTLKMNAWALAALGAALLCVEILSVGLIVRTLQSHPSNGLLRLPERQWKFPPLLRPIIALWWLAHFIAMSLTGHWLVLHMRIVLDPTAYDIWVTHIIQFIGLLGTSLSSNAFLILAAGAVFRDSNVVRVVYRVRLLIDLLVAVTVIFLPAPRWVG